MSNKEQQDFRELLEKETHLFLQTKAVTELPAQKDLPRRNVEFTKKESHYAIMALEPNFVTLSIRDLAHL